MDDQQGDDQRRRARRALHHVAQEPDRACRVVRERPRLRAGSGRAQLDQRRAAPRPRLQPVRQRQDRAEGEREQIHAERGRRSLEPRQPDAAQSSALRVGGRRRRSRGAAERGRRLHGILGRCQPDTRAG